MNYIVFPANEQIQQQELEFCHATFTNWWTEGANWAAMLWEKAQFYTEPKTLMCGQNRYHHKQLNYHVDVFAPSHHSRC